ncbi:MAG: apolipoprotein N-acyltransferase [Micropruina sp.]|uniref:apolipoprotein N-acyltransferase n=1 Tax=Micropruina sp. TaxID=2737536 RepID=UPI0039E546FD
MTDRLRALPWWLRSSLAALAGAAATLGFAPTAWWPMLILAVACLTLLTLAAPSWRQAAGAGFCFGLAWYLTGITWLSVIFVEDMIALSALEACYLAMLGLLLRLAGRSRAWPVVAAGSWMLVEYGVSNFPFGGFPWLRLGYTTVDSPLAGLLPLIGVPGAGFALALVAQLLAWAVLASGGRRRLLGAAAALAVLLSGLSGLLIPAGAEQGSVTVGYVQGNAPGGGIYGLGQPRTITYNHLAETRRLAGRIAAGELPKPDFVVWPENGTDMDPFRDAQTGAAVGAAVGAAGVPILVGTITEDPSAYERQTAAIVWYPNIGPGARYDKRNLVPFGEWVPLRSILEPLFPVVRYVGAQSTPGVGPGVLPIESAGRTVKVGDIICYELAYDSTVHDTVLGGGQVTVVQSSNAMYVGTRQVAQQFAITRARAAETRREVLVVTTTGTSGLIGPDGGVAFTLPEFQSASGVTELPLRSGATPAVLYSRGLELAGLALTVLALGLIWWRHRATVRVRQNGRSEPTQENNP